MFSRRRRSSDPDREAILSGFLPIGDHVEAAQKALLLAIPTFRSDGIPIGLALAEFMSRLDEATSALVTWAAPESLIERCREAIESAQGEARKLRLDKGDLAFESLNARVGDILYPLESIADLEVELRERPRR